MVTVIAKSYLTEENRDVLLKMAEDLIEITRKQEGCILYDAYIDINDPTVMIMFEQWTEQKYLDKHTNSEYYADIVSKSMKYITRAPEVNVCQSISQDKLMIIFYFTAIGNNLFVAKQFASDLYSIPKLLKEGQLEFEADQVGFIFPTYYMGVPLIVKEFIRRIKLKSKYTFAVQTYAEMWVLVLDNL